MQETPVPGGNNGSFQGFSYFCCSDGYGLFLPLTHLKHDGRFAEVDANTSEESSSSSNQDSEPSRPGRSASAPENRLKQLFSGLERLGVQDDTTISKLLI